MNYDIESKIQISKIPSSLTSALNESQSGISSYHHLRESSSYNSFQSPTTKLNSSLHKPPVSPQQLILPKKLPVTLQSLMELNRVLSKLSTDDVKTQISATYLEEL